MPESNAQPTDRDVLVIGAGLAGLAAADALSRDGARVTMLERRPYVGGRAYSYPHPALEEVVDSQHVLLGCCTNLIDFCERTGIADKVRWYDRQTFLEPAGCEGRTQPRASDIAPLPLPAPLQYADSFLGARMLSASDKLAVARGLGTLRHGRPESDDETVTSWYGRTAQTEGAIRNFWEPLVLATLNDSSERCSMRYAAKVFYEIFLKNREGGRLGIPVVPLSEFYGAAAERIVADGVSLELRASVDELRRLPDGRWQARCGERSWSAHDVILALPFEQTQRLLTGLALPDQAEDVHRTQLLTSMSRFVHSPFISILLWYDRQITDLDHAWLLQTTIQWFFHKSRIRGYAPERGSYVELVIAGSRSELPRSRAEILTPALAELAPFFPSTMEGGARSGRLAAGALRGDRERFLSPELPVTGLTRLLHRGALTGE